MKKISILVLFACILFANKINAQILTNGNVSSSVLNSNVLIDGSTNYSVEAGAGPNVGKGIIVPSVDLVNFAFDLNFADGSTFPTYFDGMVVYNRATGTTSITGNNPSTTTAVTPGFYYFSNPNGATNGNVTAGRWIAIGGGTSKFVDGTPTTSAVYTAGNVGIGASTTPNATAILDLNSTTSGLLVPRMTSTQRDAISSPANALLIWNTSNNTFEVYKTTCSCWVTITDAGNTPASSLVNTPPTASALNYTGEFRDGGTANIVYTYADAQGDLEGATTLQWEIANDASGTGATNLSTGASVTFTPANVARFVRIKVTPRAATGMLNGIPYYGAWTQVVSNTLPYGTALNVTGTVAQGSLLTGVYTFNSGSGTENALGSIYNWQSATNSLGLGIQDMAIPVTTPQQTTPAHTKTIIPLSTDIGRFIRFGVRATDNASLSASNFIYSNWFGPITLAVEAAPIATNLTFSPPSPGTNVTITANYSYADVNDDPEGSSLFQWYTADDATGTNQTPIAGATTRSFLVTNTQAGKFIGVGVTPVAATGITTGTEVVYYDPSASIGTATFTFTSATQISNNFHENRAMNTTDQISVVVNVTSSGSISFSTATVNGYSFSGGGTYAIGTHTVTLTATGTQTAYNAAGDTFNIQGMGTSNETITLTITHTRFGGNLTNHFNGITGATSSSDTSASFLTGQVFSNNSSCFTKLISASPCVGTSITIGSNTYSIANINGQCWMTQNLNELPNGVAVNATQWLATTPSDLGYYGYYNTTVPNGTAGWATVQTGTRGLLYQWSAAMLGSNTERARGICPTGWHVPSDCEWMYLEHGLGMSIEQQNIDMAWRANDVNQGAPGSKLRSEGGLQSNTSGFSALLVGNRSNTGVFGQTGTRANFWTSTRFNTFTPYVRLLGDAQRGIFRHTQLSSSYGFSVRCLKD